MKLAAKLLFQYRVVVNGSSGIYRRCEERYIVIDDVTDIMKGVEEIFKIGKSKKHSCVNTDGNKVFIEFVGVRDYLLIEQECDENEFWYDFIVKKMPMENKKALTLSKSQIKKEIKEFFNSKTKPFVAVKEKNAHYNIHVN